MFQRLVAARVDRYADAAARRAAPQPDHHAAHAIGRTTEVARQHALQPQPHLGRADLYTTSIEAAKREIYAVRATLLPALIKALRSKAPALERQMAIANAAIQVRYMLMRASQQVFGLEKAATYTDPMLVYLRKEITTLAARAARLGAYKGREHLIPRAYEEPTKKPDPVHSKGISPKAGETESRLRLGGGRMPELTRPPAVRARGTNAPPLRTPVQRKTNGDATVSNPHDVAKWGVNKAQSSLPFKEVIQKAFGRHDVSTIRVQIGGAAREASEAIGARAYATGETIAFAEQPDLHTAAHEAAHVIQQRAGAGPDGGIDRPGDEHEKHADQVADAVVRGESAEALLDRVTGTRGSASPVIQRKADGRSSIDTELGLYLRIHSVDLGDAIRQQLAETAWPDPASDVKFAPGGDRVFAASLAGAIAARLDDGEGFRKLVYPGNILAKYQEQVASRQTWSPLFGESLAQLVERHAIASLSERMGPRYRDVLASKVASPTADDLMGSHPIDPYVARALTKPGVVDKSEVVATEKAKDQQPAHVTVKWLGHTNPALWNFVQVTPATARVEDVAATLWGDAKKSTMAFAITKYGDLFRVAPAHARMVLKARYPHEAIGATDDNAATQLVAMADSPIKAGDAPARELEGSSKPAPSDVATREQLVGLEEAISAQLTTIHDQVSRFGMAAQLLPAMQANLDRLTKAKTADDATRALWTPVAQFQRTQLLSIAPLMAPLLQEYPALLLPDMVLTTAQRSRRETVKGKLTKLTQAAGVSHLRNESTALLNEIMRGEEADALDNLDAAHADIHDATRQAVSSGAGSDRSTSGAEQQLTSVRRRAELGLAESPYDRQKAVIAAGEVALRNRMRATDTSLEQLRESALEVYGDIHAFRRHFPFARGVPEIILAIRDHLLDVESAWKHGYDDEYERHGVQDDPNAPDDWADWLARGVGLQAAQVAFGKIAGDKSINTWFREMQEEIKDQAFRNAVTTVAIVLLITVVTSGAAAALGDAVAGAVVGETAAEVGAEAGAIAVRGIVRGVVASAVSAPINSMVQLALADGHGSLGWMMLENFLMEMFSRGMMARFRASTNALKAEASEFAQLPHLTDLERAAVTSFSYTGIELTAELVGGMASQWAAQRLVELFHSSGEAASEPFASTLLQQGAAMAIGRFFGARVHEWVTHRAHLERMKAGSLPEAKALYAHRDEFYVEAKTVGKSPSPDVMAGEALAHADVKLVHDERLLFGRGAVESHSDAQPTSHEPAQASKEGADLEAVISAPPVLDQVNATTGVSKGPSYEHDMAQLRQFYNSMESEAQHGVTNSGHAVDGYYSWQYSNKAFTFSHGLVSFEVRVFLDGTSVSGEELRHLKQQVHAGVDKHYNTRKLMVRTPDGIERRLHLEVNFVDETSSADIKVVVHPGKGYANLANWYVESNPTTHAHEVAHGAFGIKDEYVDKSGSAPHRDTPTSPYVHNDGSIMGDYWVGHPIVDNTAHPATEVKQRHLDEIGQQVPYERTDKQQQSNGGPTENQVTQAPPSATGDLAHAAAKLGVTVDELEGALALIGDADPTMAARIRKRLVVGHPPLSVTDERHFKRRLSETKHATDPSHVAAMGRIAEFRRRAGLPAFNPDVATTGTVALVMVKGQEVFGVNTSFSPESLKLRKETLDRLHAEGQGQDISTLLHEVRELKHAEAHALMLAYEQFGDLKGTVVIYVDRSVCSLCTDPAKAVAALQRLYGIDELVIIDGGGRRFSFPRAQQ